MEAEFSFSKDIITAGFADDCVAVGCRVPIKSGDRVWYNMALEGWQHNVCPGAAKPCGCNLVHAGECF